MPSAQFRHSASHKPVRQPIHRRLHLLAGFHADQAGAQSALRTLNDDLGVPAAQTALLGPFHANRLLFAWKSRRWTARRGLESDQPDSNPLLAVTAGAVIIGVLGLLMVLLDVGLMSDLAIRRQTVLLMMAGVVGAGAIVAWALVSLRSRGRGTRRFESTVRQHLAAGQWAVIVHGIPPGSQAAVLALLQGGSLGWTAAAPPQQAL